MIFSGADEKSDKVTCQNPHTSDFFHTDIQIKTLRLSLEVFNVKINMRRDSVIFFLKTTESVTPQGGTFQFKLK